jgi:hypothetical protein
MEGNEVMAIWTCFAFKGYHPKERHITYKYLGDIYLLPVREIIDAFFDQLYCVRPFIGYHTQEPIFVTFNKECFFGALRVLLPEVDVIPRFPWLRERLGPFRTDYWSYNPHLTTPDLTEFSGELDRFCLMNGKEIEMEWKL